MGLGGTYRRDAAELGHALATRGVELVYGGSHVGLMGVLADAALEAGGTVIGVITDALVDAEVAHTGLTRLHTVASMHERKRQMSDLADAFVMLPGGFGTLDEFFEALSWTQLGIHTKPCAILDSSGFYRPLLALLDQAVEQRFLTPANRSLLVDVTTVDELLATLDNWRPAPRSPKWIDRTSALEP